MIYIILIIVAIPPFIILLCMFLGYCANPKKVEVDFLEPPVLSWINDQKKLTDCGRKILLRNNVEYIVPEGRKGHFILLYDWHIKSNLIEGKEELIIPAGTYTDLASIPKVLRSLLSVLNNSVYAAIMHDYYYGNPQEAEARKVSKAAADNLFYWGMREAGVSRITAGMMYLGVHWWGKNSYER